MGDYTTAAKALAEAAEKKNYKNDDQDCTE
jgi:hypothetical protein